MFHFSKAAKGNRKVQPKRQSKVALSSINFKAFLVVSLMGLMVVSSVFTYQSLAHKIIFPITEVRLIGNIHHIDEAELKNLVLADLTQGFFDIDLNGIAAKIEKNNWVAQATLRRVWPNKVDVLLREHQAVAVWDKQTLMSSHGTLFSVDSVTEFKNLALVNGREDQARDLLLAMSQLEQLIKLPTAKIVSFKGIEGNEMLVEFDSALTAIFSLKDKDIQFKRFASLLNNQLIKIKKEQNLMGEKHLKSIDMRYSNGFSVVWLEPQKSLKKSNIKHVSNLQIKQRQGKNEIGKQHV